MQDALPFIGPKKGALLQQLVRKQRPRLAVEVGTLCGYSALLIAQAMSPDAQLISLECDWKWALVAKRFVYQATTGDRSSKPVGFPSLARITCSVLDKQYINRVSDTQSSMCNFFL